MWPRLQQWFWKYVSRLCGTETLADHCPVVDGIPRDDDSPDFAQVDSAIIRNAENEKNMSNKCGRTLLSNIDVAKETEKALKFNITQCEAGATLKFTLHMVNTDAGGPYSCDMDETNNAGKMTQARRSTAGLR